ncbi:hypothetical protein LCGC14_2490330 [marine sediment metagenome]|uniref:Uncharacterized protein n=1 Tax=marine sediment metagenome TaxID=412755 RepID=A0A0F9B5K2_9ZZZZ
MTTSNKFFEGIATKHTPLPWYPMSFEGTINYIADSDGIGIFPAKTGTPEDREADINFIIQAVNTYYGLLNACEAALDFTDMLDEELAEESVDINVMLRNVLIRVRGE